jgi:hypothetical protein
MQLILKIIRAAGRGLLALVVFFGLSIGWTGILFVINPWSNVDSGAWPRQHPIIVGSGESGKTRVILYRHLEAEVKADPTLVPWPLTATGTGQDGGVFTKWTTVSDKPWQFEASWDDRDHLMESRYRLEGERPVLVQARGRDPSFGFLGVILATITLVIWKIVMWWRRKQDLSRLNVG